MGNFEYETRQSDLERLFSKYGRIERVDIKSGIILAPSCYSFYVYSTFIVVMEVLVDLSS